VLSPGTSVDHRLGRSQLHMSASNPHIILEDQVVRHYNKLDISQRNLVAEIIQGMLEDFREVVINGNGELPPLDPYVIEHLGPFKYNAPG
jgi:hypothetical protein